MPEPLRDPGSRGSVLCVLGAGSSSRGQLSICERQCTLTHTSTLDKDGNYRSKGSKGESGDATGLSGSDDCVGEQAGVLRWGSQGEQECL